MNGASSSGKSSISQALVKLSSIPLEHIESDDIFNEKRIVNVIQKEHSTQTTLLPTYAMVRETLKTGKGVIWEEPIFHYKQLLHQMTALNLPTPIIYLIDIYCSLDVCMVRERIRKDRGIGLAKDMHGLVYENMPIRDLTIDSSDTT